MHGFNDGSSNFMDYFNPKLAKSHIRNFYGIYGDEDNLTYREGWERIPENWFKTPIDYGLIQLNLDTIALMAEYPELGR